MSKLNWQRLQVSLNNFHINNLMSYTDIKHQLRSALKNAHSKSKKYCNAKRTADLLNRIEQKNDFIIDNPQNQSVFKQLKKSMNPLVGYAKVSDPTTEKLNDLFKRASRKSPKAMKQFNLKAHKQDHMSAQQAMLTVMGREIKREKK